MPLIQPPTPPTPPTPTTVDVPVTGLPTAVDVGTGQSIPLARPTTKADVDALRAKRSELSRQIESATDRREDVVQELEKANEFTRPGLQQRLGVLDERIAQLERDIAANGRALASAPGELAREEAVAPTERYGPFSSSQLTGISIVGTVTVLMPLAVAAARMMMIRARQPKLTPEMLEATRRMERMEQAIDAVAVEVERISEGQRFVTQLMAAKQKESVMLEGGSTS
ncbi:hypothetical protein [Gemmatimonas phototrophica]|uniref:hypothetical protein n=1 Tax=Gemmatimonas phototrophica TaxID=1379270 RepID=UPI0011AE8F8C|nr:hypothetical protein [Gemmatimonas phototrophica]